MRTAGGTTRGGRGFTLIELLVVMIIIIILVGIVAGVGTGLIRDSRGKVTRDLLRTLDRVMVEYEASTGKLPPYLTKNSAAEEYDGIPGPDNMVVGYGSQGNHAPRPDCAVFFKQAKGVGKVDDILKDIPARFLKPTVTGGDPDPTPSVVDAWARKDWGDPFSAEQQTLVYYIHPGNKLAQDLYGRCINGRPYFLSAGPDNLYGTTRDAGSPTEEEALAALDDNITSYAPGPIREDMGGDR